MTDTLRLRVLVLDTWDEVEVELPATAPVADLKRDALARAGVAAAPEGYLVKYRGAEVWENGTLADAGLVPNAPLIVLPRRRIPVR
jgi:hypothetical protein